MLVIGCSFVPTTKNPEQLKWPSVASNGRQITHYSEKLGRPYPIPLKQLCIRQPLMQAVCVVVDLLTREGVRVAGVDLPVGSGGKEVAKGRG